MAPPQVTPITEKRHAGGFMVSEARGRRARDAGTLITGQKLDAGTVLGKITVGAAGSPVAIGTNVGTSTFVAITVGAPAVAGNYVVELLSATNFVVNDPFGVEIGHGVLGSPFSAGGIGFTLTSGGSPAAGDSYSIPITAGSGKYTAFDPTAGDGSENAVAVLWDFTDATSADKPIAIIDRSAEVNSSELIWGTNVTTTPQKTAALAQLAAFGIIAR